jgi:hypothetical protein
MSKNKAKLLYRKASLVTEQSMDSQLVCRWIPNWCAAAFHSAPKRLNETVLLIVKSNICGKKMKLSVVRK